MLVGVEMQPAAFCMSARAGDKKKGKKKKLKGKSPRNRSASTAASPTKRIGERKRGKKGHNSVLGPNVVTPSPKKGVAGCMLSIVSASTPDRRAAVCGGLLPWGAP